MLSPFTVTGIGLHTGEISTVSIRPRPPCTGVVFEVHGETIEASPLRLSSDSHRRTTLEKNGRSIQTVEHLLAAATMLDMKDLCIAVEGPEIPILDGSAALWFRHFIANGARPGVRLLPLRKDTDALICVTQGDSIAHIRPTEKDADAFIDVLVDLSQVRLPPMHHRFYPASDNFEDIAGARTFAAVQDVQPLLDAGLAKGGSLENAVVLSDGGCVNPEGLRFGNEPARHKVLDAIGDLFLLGGLPRAQIHLQRPGHAANHEIVRVLSAIVSKQTGCHPLPFDDFIFIEGDA